jgi:hypothetical protein
VPTEGVGRRYEMQSYYTMGIAAETRMHQLLAEAEHGRLVRGLEMRRDHRASSPSIRTRIASAFQRLGGRLAAAVTTGKTAVQGR